MQEVEQRRSLLPRITISFKHSPCLQCFELPLNNQILTRNGIINDSIKKPQSFEWGLNKISGHREPNASVD
ncbi:hypothetical protein FM037_06875 [Shewanella psychropiezotolerans]|uniref:Uncharacterized protein n=1 Tax=Shewanella psychropiezotolerans TaxID=2593655 RepID=A0ABX5WV77_9GAMM|nr:hypothetical protein [Shewanella sp. YLB-07]QDO83005.1 hypothetical protein FM037_06875 [Shewanella psychropiezotolerans]